METRPPWLAARVLQALGIGARVPAPAGPLLVRSVHVRLPGCVLAQIFFPAAIAADVVCQQPQSAEPFRRHYRNGVIKGTSVFSKTPKWLLELFLGATPHSLLGNGRATNPAPIAHKVPVVFWSHGLGGNCEVYTKTASDLASYGFIVVCLEHEDGTASHAKNARGEVVPYEPPPKNMAYTRENVVAFRDKFFRKRIAELRTLVQFFSKPNRDDLDIEDVGVAATMRVILSAADTRNFILGGHSFGAATCVMLSREWKDESVATFRGMILLDVWPFPIPNVEQGIPSAYPVVSILSQSFKESSEHAFTKTMLARSDGNVFASLFIPGSVHSSFSDTPWWAPKFIGTRANLRGTLEPALVQDAFVQVCARFAKMVTSSTPESRPLPSAFQQECLARDSRLHEFAFVA